MTPFAADYRGWRIWKWTDWKEGAGDFLTAQWLARKGEGEAERFLYASTPGTAGEYRPGDNFDIARRPGQVIIDADSTEEIRSKEQARTYESLI